MATVNPRGTARSREASREATGDSLPSMQVRSLLRGRWAIIGVLAVGSLFSGLAESGVISIVAQIASALVTGAHHVNLAMGQWHGYIAISTLITIAFALSATRLVLQLPLSYLPARVAASVQAQLRKRLLAAFTSASWAMQSRDREGHLQEIMTQHVGEATVAVVQVMNLVATLFVFVVLMISALIMNTTAALIVTGAAACIFVMLRPLGTLGSRFASSLSRNYLDYASGISEAVRLAEDTQVFGVADAQRARVAGLLNGVTRFFFQTQLVSRLAQSVYQSMIYLLIVAALGGVYLMGSGHAASLGAVVLLLIRAGTYGQQAQASYQVLRQTLPYLARLETTQRRYELSRRPTGKFSLTIVRRLACENVCYSYDGDRPILSDASFEVQRGEAIGIIGPSGAGKSTLVQILLGLRTPDSGRYLVNGIDVHEFAVDDWHRRIAYVQQEPQLLHATVADNIRFFRDLADEEIRRAAQLAGIHGEILAWTAGYDTLVGPRADAVSGGQQQRICLARALAARPEVLVLDEPTSALDPHSEFAIQDSLGKLRGELTLFTVAHRLSTIDICERVMVIVDGRLESFDTTTRLLDSSAYYRATSVLTGGLGEQRPEPT